MLLKVLLVIIAMLFTCSVTYGYKNLIPVKIGILESLNITNSTASERFKSAYLSAIYYAMGENDKKLASCGYLYQIVPAFFSNSSLLSEKTMASELETAGTWIILGPKRSDPYVMAMKGLHSTPLISLMAASAFIENLKPPYFTAAPGIHFLVEAASKAVEKENIGYSYGTFVDATCIECKDFENEFDKINKNKLKKVFSIDGGGDAPSVERLFQKLATNKIDFLLLPNYSKFTVHVISQIYPVYPNIKFLGSDGWGQTVWSFLPGYGLSSNIIGISIRVGYSDEGMEDYYKVYSLDVAWKNELLKPPYAAYGSIELIQKITDDLCNAKPKNKHDFFTYLLRQNKSHYRTKVPISVYRLRRGMLEFSYSTSISK